MLALFMNFLLMLTGPELSLDEQELLPLVPLEPDEEVVTPDVEVVNFCDVDVGSVELC